MSCVEAGPQSSPPSPISSVCVRACPRLRVCAYEVQFILNCSFFAQCSLIFSSINALYDREQYDNSYTIGHDDIMTYIHAPVVNRPEVARECGLV